MERNLFGYFHWFLNCSISPFVPLVAFGIIKRGLEGKQ